MHNKCTLADTHPYTHTPAARPQQPLVLMDGSLITTLTLGLFSLHSSPRTCVRVSAAAGVCASLGVICCQHGAGSGCSLADFLLSFLLVVGVKQSVKHRAERRDAAFILRPVRFPPPHSELEGGRNRRQVL